MKSDFLVLLAVFVPVIGSFFLPLLGQISEKRRNFFSLFLVFTPFACSLFLLPGVMNGETVTIALTIAPSFGLFHVDTLAVFMALVSSSVGFLIVLYSFDYIKHYENRNEYYLMVVLFLGSMMGLVYSRNLIFLYLFWEITAVACWRLIGFFREKKDVLRADKAFLVTVFGALMMLLGFIVVYEQTGTFDLGGIKAALGSTPVSNLAVVLILFGLLSKSATLPFHTWLPDAGVAPSPVTALLHAAVLVKIGVYVYARLFVTTMPVDDSWHTIVPVIAAVSALVSAGAAMIETDIKRIIAYSTISQLGFIFLGLSIGNEIGVVGGLLYILMHSLSKGGLFLCAGIVEQNTHEKDITKLGGLFATMPITAVSFILCAASVMGIPPFGGFFAKYFVITGAVQSGQFLIAATFILGACMTVIYLLRLFSLVFLGEAKMPAKEKSTMMIACVAILAILSIAGGVFINYPSNMATAAAQQMMELVK